MQQRVALYPFHHDAYTQTLHRLYAERSHHMRMLKLNHHLELFPQHLLKHRLTGFVCLQSLQQPPLTITLGTRQHIMDCLTNHTDVAETRADTFKSV